MKKGLVNHDFFKVWSSDMAYILGFITADGYINESKNTLAIQLSSKDKSLLGYIKKTIKSSNKINVYERNNCKDGIKRTRCCFSITSKSIISDLKALGLQQKKTGFEQWANPPENYICDYIRGYFDGDGSIYKRKAKNGKGFNIEIACANRMFLEKIQETLKCGKIYKKSSIYYYMITNMEGILIFKNFIYNGNYSLSRKFNKIKNLNKDI